MPLSPEFRFATESDAPKVVEFIYDLAAYERLAHEAVVTEEQIRESLFGEKRFAEVVLGEFENETVAFALFFHNYSTFLGKPGLYLEDLFVKPHARGKGIGKALMRHLAKIAVERGCGRFEWWVLDWNEPSIEFYRALGAVSMSDWTVQRLAGEALRRLAESA